MSGISAATVDFTETHAALAADPLTIAAGLAAQSSGPYVLYENRGSVQWAEGAKVVVRILPDRVIVDADDRQRIVTGGNLLTAAGSALESAGSPGWRAYGWISFELEAVLRGRPCRPDTLLGCLLIPRREIRFDTAGAVMRVAEAADLEPLRARLAGAAAATPEPSPTDGAGLADLEYGADAYRTAVAAVVNAIESGRVDKVVLSRPVPVNGDIDLPATYLRGRRANTPARSFLLDLGGWQAAGFSPEIVAQVGPCGEVMSQPLAGTRALVGDDATDRARRDELLRDPKEVFEHAISVRIAADELTRVCVDGSVGVNEFMAVRERGSVQHLASELTGDLAADRSRWDVLQTLSPAVTSSGVPKAQACDLIGEMESAPRGLYAGAVLTVDDDGSLDAALALRTVFRHGGDTWLRAGAGIVAQSNPDRELEETREKLRSVSRFLVPAHSIRAAGGADA